MTDAVFSVTAVTAPQNTARGRDVPRPPGRLRVRPTGRDGGQVAAVRERREQEHHAGPQGCNPRSLFTRLILPCPVTDFMSINPI